MKPFYRSLRFLLFVLPIVAMRGGCWPRPPSGRTSSSSWPTTWAGATSAFTAARSRRRTSTGSPRPARRLEAFYVQPVCSPTRAALMTGRYPMRHGLQVGVVRPWAQYGLPLEERTLAPGAEGGGLRDRHLRQVAPRPLPAGVPADPARVRPPVRPLQRRTRLLHPRSATAASTGTATTRSAATRATRRT